MLHHANAPQAFPSILALLAFALQGLWKPGLCRVTGIPLAISTRFTNDVNKIMTINCQIHTVCLGIVSSIIIPSFRPQQHAHAYHVVISASAFAASLPPSSAPPAASLSSRDSPSSSLSFFSGSSYHDLSIQLTIRSLAVGSML